MAKYDNYIGRTNITRTGKKIVDNRNKFFIKKIQKHSGKELNELSFLELGPGNGYMAELCSEYGIKYSAIEGNEMLASALKAKGYDVSVSYFPPIEHSGKFDVIFFNQVFEHMPNSDTGMKLLEDCYNHLNDNGLVLLAAPEILMFKDDFFACDYTHNMPTSLISSEQMLLDSGFAPKELGHYTLNVTGTFICGVISRLTHIFYDLKFFHVFFGKKHYKIKTSLLPSFYVLAQKS